MRSIWGGCAAILIATGAARSAAFGAGEACSDLVSLTLPGTTVTLAAQVEGDSLPAAGPPGAASLPVVCRVAATLRPTTDSDIKIEVWMPATTWNGKFQAVGNGGWSGAIAYGAMRDAIRRGYATSSTDTGHSGSSAQFAAGHPEKLADFGYRAVHEMAAVSKKLVTAYYGTAPKHSYWKGCSAGGRQGLKEAQEFPADFDGIIAGAPASDWTGRAAQSMRIAQAVHKDEASYIPPAMYPVIHDAVVHACDALDGVRDGVLENPRACRFDPEILQCKAGEAACLTRPQVEAARQFYRSPANPRTSRQITGLEPGSELGWGTWGGPQPFAIGHDHFRYVVFDDPAWDFRRLNFDADIVLAERSHGSIINALDPNLERFFARGGKLLQYHGWSDPQISPGSSVQYYDRVSRVLGGRSRIDASYRLFMAPGMAHCAGGEGPDAFDTLSALEQWVEHGQPPERLQASRTRGGKVDRTRPLCPYPQAAVYTGTGSTDDAANFVCGTH
jgi:feruloyl esterase